MDEEPEFLVVADENDDEGDENKNDMNEWNEDDDGDDDGDGDDINATTEETEVELCSPLIAAAKAGDLILVRSLLLEQGVDKSETTNIGRTAMWHAAKNGHLEIVRLLLEQGADKELGGPDMTPLRVASAMGHLLVVQLLLEQGADIEKADSFGRTALFSASTRGHSDVVRYLLEQGANRDKTNIVGWTPLHWAAFLSHLETAKLLMIYGADLDARTIGGELPINYAHTDEIKQAIRDEPRRRMDHGHKRATEQDRQPNAAASASAQHEELVEAEEPCSKKPRLEEEVEKGKMAEEDEDSEPSSDEEGN